MIVCLFFLTYRIPNKLTRWSIIERSRDDVGCLFYSFLVIFLFIFTVRRGFILTQRSHLRTLKIFVSEKSGKYWIKSGNREILRGFIFFLYPRLHSLEFYFTLSITIEDKKSFSHFLYIFTVYESL